MLCSGLLPHLRSCSYVVFIYFILGIALEPIESSEKTRVTLQLVNCGLGCLGRTVVNTTSDIQFAMQNTTLFANFEHHEAFLIVVTTNTDTICCF